jgi:hypothetical protein
VWQATCHGPGAFAGTTAIALSPDGPAVYVTGSVGQASGLNEYATIGYDAATGHQQWLASYRTAQVNDNAAGVTGSGGNAVVTGTSGPFGGQQEFATVAYQG